MGIAYRHITLLARGRVLKTVWLSLALASMSSATLINYDPAATTAAGWSACGSFAGYNCLTTAYFDTTSLDAQNDSFPASTFQSAWNAWDASGGGQGWTLDYAGDPGGTFNVTTATAQQFSGVTLGGLTININLSGLTLPTPGVNQQIVWAQGLYVNYTPGPGTIVPGYYAMDTSTLSSLTCGGSIFCPPAYPYQYNDDHFYDQPKDYYQAPGTTQAFFDADAYIALEDFGTKTLTIYDGISYGFQNYVSPEPSAWVLIGSGFVAVLLARRRRLNG
jgi:hypothetical protein